MLSRTCIFACLMFECGGSVESVGQKEAGPDGAPDGQILDGADEFVANDAGFTKCSTPEGYRVCGGSSECPSGIAGCDQCVYSDAGSLGICSNTFNAFSGDPCWLGCGDQQVCYLERPNALSLSCVPYNFGVLASQYVDHNRLRYADLGTWTGDPIPKPTSCPKFNGFAVCGGACAGCNPGERCLGPSPLHPYGVCIAPPSLCYADGSKPCTSPGESCFTFTVDPPGQVLADQYGKCVPTAQCQAMATSLPGGGKCK